jgi:cyclase
MNTYGNRVIPCLLLEDGGLVKTRQFQNPQYLGDPINAVRIFNEKYVDELVFLDITASRTGGDPDYDLIGRISTECFMPLCYGGGIRTLEQAKRIVSAGVEKIALNSIAIDNPKLVSTLSSEFGASSIVATIDVKLDKFGLPKVFHPGKRVLTKLDPIEHARTLASAGAGEIFLNDVDRDGMLVGFNLDLIKKVSSQLTIPLVACGGSANLNNMKEAIDAGASAAAAGSMFVFYGPHRAVLISYPSRAEVAEIFAKK